jgi:hypothetical protein
VGTGILDAFDNEHAVLGRVEPATTAGPPLETVAVLAELAGELADAEPGRRRLIARRLAATAVQAAAGVHAAFGDRPDLEDARRRALEGIRPQAASGSCPGALGRVATAALALPPLYDDGHADWQVGAIAFADERQLRALHAALLGLAATALREAAAA